MSGYFQSGYRSSTVIRSEIMIKVVYPNYARLGVHFV